MLKHKKGPSPSKYLRSFADARIISFEPLAGPRLVEAAVGPQPGEARIHVSARDDSSSLLPITARQSGLFPGTAEVGTATIRVARLADEVPAADLAAPALASGGRLPHGL